MATSVISTSNPSVAVASRTALYRPLDFYMVRTPILPIQIFDQLTTPAEQVNQTLLKFSQNNAIREAIAVASLSLADSLSQLTRDDHPRKKEQVRRSFLHYLVRMSTRPTPFGLFSGVAYGEWGERTVLEIGPHTAHHKRSRPDMEWLLQVLRDLERDPRVLHQLHVQTNSLHYTVGSRIKLPYVTRYGQRDTRDKQNTFSQEISIRATPVVQMTLAVAERPIPFRDLLEKIHQAYPDTPREKISRFLEQLFEQEVLISDLRPPLTNPAPLRYILDRLDALEGIDEIKFALQSIAGQLADYDALPLGQGESRYREIVNTMKEVADVKSPVQIDLALQTKQVQLPHSIGEEAAKAAEILWRLSPARTGYPHLAGYRTEFLERYGSYREVPLLELLDEDYGLGAPPTYEFPASRRSFTPLRSEQQTRRDTLLMEWTTQALLTGEIEVELTEERVRLLEEDTADTRQAPASLDLTFSIAAASAEALDRGDYRLIIGPNGGAHGAGKTFGRLADLLPDPCKEKLEQIHEHEQLLSPHAVFAEVAYLPIHARAANISLTANHRPYEIALGTTSSKEETATLPLSDLRVGLHGDAFYLRSHKLNRIVIPVTGHMLNTLNSPNLYRFLRELEAENVRVWTLVQWGSLEHASFRPRLRYGRTILAPAAWRLNKWQDENDSNEHFRQKLSEWRQRWRVPQYVWIAEGDRRLLMDLEHPMHVEDLCREYNKLQVGSGILFTELAMDLNEAVVRGEEGWLLNEVVVPFVKQVADYRAVAVAPVGPTIPAAERVHLPGSEWLFLKLYGPRGREEELIGWHLREFCARAEQEGIARESFFMRYADPDHHVRLRFHAAPTEISNRLFPWVSEWARQMQAEGLLTRLVIDTYDPEIERYGGPGLIALAERAFSADSRVVAEWLARHRMGQMSMELTMLGVISIVDMAEQFGLSLVDQLRWFDTRVSPKKYVHEFRQDRRQYLRLIDPDAQHEGLRSHADGGWIRHTLLQRQDAFRSYAAEIRKLEQQGDASQSMDSILASMVHLHLNRLLGTDRPQEDRVMGLARHALFHLNQMRMNRT